jgi:hypothetical protein
MTELIQNTEGDPEIVVEKIKSNLVNILQSKQQTVKWKLNSIKKAFDEDILPHFLRSRKNNTLETKSGEQAMSDLIHIFINDNEGYLDWIEKNQSGYVVNCDKKPTPEYLILHKSTCNTIRSATRGPGNWTNTQYIKVCSLDKQKLAEWAKSEVNGELQSCQRCKA